MKSGIINRHQTAVIKKGQPDDSHKFQPLPEPTGKFPYRLALSEILKDQNNDRLIFHMVGDTGSIRSANFQKLVVNAMSKQYQTVDSVFRPSFLYHLGDVVYNFGEAEQYDSQFFSPYADYPGPIVAIAGNHDSDVNPLSKESYSSLNGFVNVFCDREPRTVPFSNNAERKSMIQPNVYWTLNTSLATIIGLHCNVPRYGVITEEQRNWFIGELKAANAIRSSKAIIICMHHAPYSADTNHGASIPMIEFLNSVFEETGVLPDIVFSGHVHNYQRFHTQQAHGKIVPFIVAGAGGYDELHRIAETDDLRFTNNSELFASATLERFCDTRHGYLKIMLERKNNRVHIIGEYYTLPNVIPEDGEIESQLEDRFIVITN